MEEIASGVLLGSFALFVLLGPAWVVAWFFPYGLSPRRLPAWIRAGAIPAALALWVASVALVDTIFNGAYLGGGSCGIYYGAFFFLLPLYYVWIVLLLVGALVLTRQPVSESGLMRGASGGVDDAGSANEASRA
jgi:hypothetical protein